MKLVHWVFAVCLFTASFDRVLNFQVGGSVRFAQILMIFICLAAMARIIQDGRILWPRGATALSLWILVQALCLPLSGNYTFGFELFGLLLFTSIGLFAVVQLYGLSNLIEPIMKVYMASFVFVAAYGLVQFALPLFFGITAPFTVQWILHGRIARINGFCYEPSYFVTYLFMGWIMLVELRLNKARIAQGRFWKWATIMMGLCLFLSTSKTAWIFLIVELLARIAPKVWRSFRLSLQEMRTGRLMLRIPGRKAVLLAVVFAGTALILGSVLVRAINPLLFLSGSGLFGTPAHSLNSRSSGADETIAAFEASPFVGRSLGGVPVYLAARNGIVVTTREEFRLHWGFPVILEVLLASGAIGFIPFAIFLYTATFGAYRFASRYWPQERAKWLRALARAMIFEWMLLMVDQNLMRLYLWFHFTMVLLVAYHLEYAPAPELALQPAASGSPLQSFHTLEAPAVL